MNVTSKGRKMNLNVIKSLVVCACLLASSLASASLITHNDYTLDTETNTVTNEGTEWVQWNVTAGMSINEALAAYANDGWTLASNVQMSNLYTDFGFEATTDENVYIGDYGNYTPFIDASNHDLFLSLFSITWNISGGNRGEGVDALESTAAFYGSDADGDGFYNLASVMSDLTTNGLESVEKAHLTDDSILRDYSAGNSMGVALVRTTATSVPEPSSIAIFSLGLMGLRLRRRKNV